MKARLTPTEIALRELPAEGREFIFTRDSGELNETLKDLIGTNPYSVRLKITPMGNTFDLQGRLQASLDLQCSLCVLDFKHPVNVPLRELILIEKALGKGDQMSRNNHAHEWESGGPNYIILESDIFDLAEYIHEQIALAEPIRPLGTPQCDEVCENLKDRVERPWLTYGQSDEKGTVRPFEVLEKLKLKS
jgi:uncharacterized metal-binding protein YceD (DUF177 family)